MSTHSQGPITSIVLRKYVYNRYRETAVGYAGNLVALARNGAPRGWPPLPTGRRCYGDALSFLLAWYFIDNLPILSGHPIFCVFFQSFSISKLY